MTIRLPCLRRLVLVLATLLNVPQAIIARPGPLPDITYTYNICNGLSNQLLYHSASIALAITSGKMYVLIPDHFIVDGTQDSDLDVLPTLENSVPFGYVFDKNHFREVVQSLGNITIRYEAANANSRLAPCSGMSSVANADPELLWQILNAFIPSEGMKEIIDHIAAELNVNDWDKGVCVHHRDGADWHEHCSRWSSIPDGVYRGNCLGVAGASFLESLFDRGVTSDTWVYYCGDHEPPNILNELIPVYTKDNVMKQNLEPVFKTRDVRALIDYFVCRRIDHFVGNSVSTFSALQIAVRRSENAYWYNSQSIPLSDFWRSYHVPIVFTYTETSKLNGKHMLKASITSVVNHMPKNPIHILYHGKHDRMFLKWLEERNVVVHEHKDPPWKHEIEKMRRNGNVTESSLFSHEGNYFGTWQRIDIPLFVNSEYALLLDFDTIVKKPFDLIDFGLNTTLSIAMSSELDIHGNLPSNAGVMLMNIPGLRRTHGEFVNYIISHVDTAKFDHPAPNDQGAYLSFYKDAYFLPIKFNFKPYWSAAEEYYAASYIIHFHGAKPHDYLSSLMGNKCDESISVFCEKESKMAHLCEALKEFSLNADVVDYCAASFPLSQKNSSFCVNVLDSIARVENGCSFFENLIKGEKDPFKEDIQKIIQNDKKTSGKKKKASGLKHAVKRHLSRKSHMSATEIIIQALFSTLPVIILGSFLWWFSGRGFPGLNRRKTIHYPITTKSAKTV